jgi:hypothetical protein
METRIGGPKSLSTANAAKFAASEACILVQDVPNHEKGFVGQYIVKKRELGDALASTSPPAPIIESNGLQSVMNLMQTNLATMGESIATLRECMAAVAEEQKQLRKSIDRLTESTATLETRLDDLMAWKNAVCRRKIAKSVLETVCIRFSSFKFAFLSSRLMPCDMQYRMELNREFPKRSYSELVAEISKFVPSKPDSMSLGEKHLKLLLRWIQDARVTPVRAGNHPKELDSIVAKVPRDEEATASDIVEYFKSRSAATD